MCVYVRVWSESSDVLAAVRVRMRMRMSVFCLFVCVCVCVGGGLCVLVCAFVCVCLCLCEIINVFFGEGSIILTFTDWIAVPENY